MFQLRLKKAAAPFFLISMILAAAALNPVSTSARADFYSGYCNMNCGFYGSPAFSPFAGSPIIPSPYGNGYSYGYGGMTGQFQPVDPRVQALAMLSQADYTPMGTTMGSSVGLAPIAANWAALPYENSLAGSGGAFVPGH